MAINRTKFSSRIAPQEQSKISKVIVANTTMRGYAHIVTVRTQIVNDAEVECYQDILIHPDRAADIDIARFDAVSFQGLTPRQSPGDPRPNTTYHWAQGCKAIGKHLIERAKNKAGEDVVYLAGVGIYMTPEQVKAEEDARAFAAVADHQFAAEAPEA
jgi:hypothetical protein